MPKGYRCCVPGCSSTSAGEQEIAMFALPLPNNRNLLEKWTELIDRPDLLNKKKYSRPRVCEGHFEKHVRNKRGELLPGAYPTLNLPARPDSTLDNTSQNDQNDDSSSSGEISIKMEVNENEDEDVLQLEKEIADMESSTNLFVKKISKKSKTRSRSKFMDIFESWHTDMKAKFSGHMYTNKFKLHCMNMLCKAPKTYPILRQTFELPTIKRLKNTKIILSPGINKQFVKVVGKKLLNAPRSKHVVVCLEEIIIKKHLYYDIRHDNVIGFHNMNGKNSLNEAADTAFVISIKGCFVNYQQMIGYCLINTFNKLNIRKWLENTITALFTVGLSVHAVVSRHTLRLESLATFICTSLDTPSFKVDNNIIYYLFDIPQTINAIRDSFMSCDFIYDGKMASWEHLEIFFQTEMDRQIKLAPKLSDAHLRPRGAQSELYQLTKDVFSRTVAAAMSAEIDEERLPPEAHGTVDFFMKMNDLINVCNSTRINHPNHYIRAFDGGKYQIEALTSALTVFQNIEVINRTTGNNEDDTFCFKAIVVSIKAILQMWADFSFNGLKYLLTGRLKSEEIINEFIQRSQNQNSLITAIKLRRAFSTIALKNLIENASLTNCKANLDELVLPDGNTNDFSVLEKYLPKEPKSSPLIVGTKSYRLNLFTKTSYELKLPLTSAFQYMCGNLLTQCVKKHQCTVFQQYLDEAQESLEESQISEVSTRMIRPTKEFLAYVKQCDAIYTKESPTIIYRPNMGLNLYNKLQIPDFQPCSCFPCDYLKKLFLRHRIYTTLKNRNRQFATARMSYSTDELILNSFINSAV